MNSRARFILMASILLVSGPTLAQEPATVTPEAQEAPQDPQASPTPPGAAAEPSPEGSGAQFREVPHFFSGLFDAFDYEPRGRRDPFSQTIVGRPLEQVGDAYGPLLPLQRFNLEELRLTGIIWNVARPKAILKDPSGNIHVVTLNSKIGSRNGYVAAIREGEIVVVETIEQDGRLVSTAQVVKIAK